jgi:hypothetical protein
VARRAEQQEVSHAKPVGIWLRVSTEDQVKGESPEHHEKSARFYADSKGWMVKDVEDVILPRFAQQDLLGLADYEAVVRMGHDPQTVGQRLSLALRARVLNSERRGAELRMVGAKRIGLARRGGSGACGTPGTVPLVKILCAFRPLT